MKNKKLIISLVSVVTLVMVSIASYQLLGDEGYQQNTDNTQVVANYKGGFVTIHQAQMELDKIILKNSDLEGLTFDKLNSDQKEMVVKEVVLKEMAYQEAKNLKLHKTDEYYKSLKLFETEILKQKLFLKLASDAKKEENLKESYDTLVAELKDKKDIRISYIALETETEAKSLHKILTQYPNSFAKQARLKSIDKEIAKKDGDLGFVLEDVLPKDITTKVKELKIGQISQPFILTDKWVIIKFIDERPAQIIEFEKVKKTLAQSLSRKALQDFISASLEKAEISIVIK